eukprot:1969180-Pyramimonas_sp.AAC.1
MASGHDPHLWRLFGAVRAPQNALGEALPLAGIPRLESRRVPTKAFEILKHRSSKPRGASRSAPI